jgi:methyl-accepting chemotaxis protein
MKPELAEDLTFVRLDDETRATLRRLLPLIETHGTRMLDVLYGHMDSWPDLKGLFASEARRTHARDRQAEHWRRLFSATYDDDYVQSVQRVALAHARIGLKPRYYIGSYLVVLEEMHALVLKEYSTRFGGAAVRARAESAIRAVDRAVMFDLQQVVGAYMAKLEDEYRQRLDDLSDQFGAVVSHFTGEVNTRAGTLRQEAGGLQDNAETATRQAELVAGGTERSSAEMQTVASAAEEITASIGEITRQTQQAAEVTTSAVETVRRATAIVGTLNTAAARIGDVVNLIQSIAGQTNLLALNATIEAARAGEAGRGFAVVAGEVKGLSAQTARATDDIRSQVGAVQGVVGQIAAAMGEIAHTVDRVREATAAIAGAVEEQSAVTQEISRSVASAAAGAGGVNDGAREMQAVADRTAQNARGVAEASDGLLQAARALEQEKTGFMDRIRLAERRREPRHEVRLDATVETASGSVPGQLQNVSPGGAAVRLDASRLPQGVDRVKLKVPGVKDGVDARIVSRSINRASLAFIDRVQGQFVVDAALRLGRKSAA